MWKLQGKRRIIQENNPPAPGRADLGQRDRFFSFLAVVVLKIPVEARVFFCTEEWKKRQPSNNERLFFSAPLHAIFHALFCRAPTISAHSELRRILLRSVAVFGKFASTSPLIALRKTQYLAGSPADVSPSGRQEDYLCTP